ncbi:MAG: DUF448 domain-containing protein [Actinobacteria bacterium]|uniref:Unannotated protein n=1 Tax=freshwater metagenome TaxID=449393 RepID=A0A6J7EQ00_9ZZZZ|nr:DUF448 domain-containing protein [Actinomycetota bacterium]
MSGPVRTCIGCRQRAEPAELLRVVIAEGSLVADARRRLPGRGAWIHPVAACVEAATRKRAWGRALRHPGAIELSAVQELTSGRV